MLYMGAQREKLIEKSFIQNILVLVDWKGRIYRRRQCAWFVPLITALVPYSHLVANKYILVDHNMDMVR